MSSRHPLHGAVLLAVACGGALGAALRHALTVGDPATGAGFPWATLATNVAGAFLLGLLPASGWVRRRPLLPPFLGTGVLGGFTTFSAWSEQTRALVAEGAVATAATYALGTVIACVAAVVLADRFTSPAVRHEFELEEGDL